MERFVEGTIGIDDSQVRCKHDKGFANRIHYAVGEFPGLLKNSLCSLTLSCLGPREFFGFRKTRLRDIQFPLKLLHLKKQLFSGSAVYPGFFLYDATPIRIAFRPVLRSVPPRIRK